MAMISVRIPDELLEQLEKTAVNTRRSKGWIINEALREYLVREEHKQRIFEETYEALVDIKAGCLSDGTEVLGWLGSWGDEDEKAPP